MTDAPIDSLSIDDDLASLGSPFFAVDPRRRSSTTTSGLLRRDTYNVTFTGALPFTAGSGGDHRHSNLLSPGMRRDSTPSGANSVRRRSSTSNPLHAPPFNRDADFFHRLFATSPMTSEEAPEAVRVATRRNSGARLEHRAPTMKYDEDVLAPPPKPFFSGWGNSDGDDSSEDHDKAQPTMTSTDNAYSEAPDCRNQPHTRARRYDASMMPASLPASQRAALARTLNLLGKVPLATMGVHAVAAGRATPSMFDVSRATGTKKLKAAHKALCETLDSLWDRYRVAPAVRAAFAEQYFVEATRETFAAVAGEVSKFIEYRSPAMTALRHLFALREAILQSLQSAMETPLACSRAEEILLYSSRKGGQRSLTETEEMLLRRSLSAQMDERRTLEEDSDGGSATLTREAELDALGVQVSNLVAVLRHFSLAILRYVQLQRSAAEVALMLPAPSADGPVHHRSREAQRTSQPQQSRQLRHTSAVIGDDRLFPPLTVMTPDGPMPTEEARLAAERMFHEDFRPGLPPERLEESMRQTLMWGGQSYLTKMVDDVSVLGKTPVGKLLSGAGLDFEHNPLLLPPELLLRDKTKTAPRLPVEAIQEEDSAPDLAVDHRRSYSSSSGRQINSTGAALPASRNLMRVALCEADGCSGATQVQSLLRRCITPQQCTTLPRSVPSTFTTTATDPRAITPKMLLSGDQRTLLQHLTSGAGVPHHHHHQHEPNHHQHVERNRPTFAERRSAEVVMLRDGCDVVDPVPRRLTERQRYFKSVVHTSSKKPLMQQQRPTRQDAEDEKRRERKQGSSTDNVYQYPAAVYEPARRTDLEVLQERLYSSIDPRTPVVRPPVAPLSKLPPSLLNGAGASSDVKTKNPVSGRVVTPYALSAPVPPEPPMSLVAWHHFLLAEASHHQGPARPAERAAANGAGDPSGNPSVSSSDAATVSDRLTRLRRRYIDLGLCQPPPPAASAKAPQQQREQETPTAASSPLHATESSCMVRTLADAALDYRAWIGQFAPGYLPVVDRAFSEELRASYNADSSSRNLPPLSPSVRSSNGGGADSLLSVSCASASFFTGFTAAGTGLPQGVPPLSTESEEPECDSESSSDADEGMGPDMYL